MVRGCVTNAIHALHVPSPLRGEGESAVPLTSAAPKPETP